MNGFNTIVMKAENMLLEHVGLFVLLTIVEFIDYNTSPNCAANKQKFKFSLSQSSAN